MSDSIHGHEMMHFLQDSGRAYTRDELLQAVAAQFGADARFHTCFADGLTAGQLIDFLAAKGKFVADGAGLRLREDGICAH